MASVPAGHPYIAAITDSEVVDLLPDPPVAGGLPGQWWPPRLLDPDWVAARTDSFDLLHLHFGLESHPVERIERALDVVQGAGRPVVFTVHDLENPQLVDQAPHDRVLDLVVPRADALLTLTDAAAADIGRRWGRSAVVAPHPRLQSPAPVPSGTRATRRIGVHLRDLRPNVDGVGTVATLVRAIAELRAQGVAVVGEVHLNERVRDEQAAGRIAALVEGRGDVELHRHARLGDDQLAAAIARLDALVLPYRWGTHSGWIELAHDAAVPVVGTDVGALVAQHPADYHVYALGDPASLARAIAAATARPWAGAGRVAEADRRRDVRDREVRTVRDLHSALYRDLVAARVAA